MTLLTDAQVQFILADFANTDGAGKLNVLGGGIAFIGIQDGGATAPFALAVEVRVPAKYAGTSYALTVELHDATIGQLVGLPGPDGTLQALRAQQVVTVQSVQLPPQFAVPPDTMQNHTMVMNFPGGLPLAAGHSFEWRVQIDGQTRHWFHRFHVLGPNPGVVFGGPTGPATIPGIADYVIPDDSTQEPGAPEDK